MTPLDAAYAAMAADEDRRLGFYERLADVVFRDDERLCPAHAGYDVGANRDHEDRCTRVGHGLYEPVVT